jgi:hypothetical protein
MDLSPDFAALLERIGRDPGLRNLRFVARNFLLDEGVVPERVRSYEDGLPVGSFADIGAWVGTHRDYVETHLNLNQPADGPPGTLDPERVTVCPETFRYDAAFRSPETDEGLHLLRVVDARHVSTLSGFDLASLTEAARAFTAERDTPSAETVESALYLWMQKLKLRPVFAVFWEDVKELFGDRPENDRPGWADDLRDRLGLYHFDPGTRSASAILVFRYAVGQVPRRRGLGRRRPLAVPTVLDGEFSEAFCPVPRELAFARTMDLVDRLETPAREIVHPLFRFQAKDLYRLGTVTRPVPAHLAGPRASHLFMLRELSGRPDYATVTDGDLL